MTFLTTGRQLRNTANPGPGAQAAPPMRLAPGTTLAANLTFDDAQASNRDVGQGVDASYSGQRQALARQCLRPERPAQRIDEFGPISLPAFQGLLEFERDRADSWPPPIEEAPPSKRPDRVSER